MSQILSGNPVIDARLAELLSGGVAFHLFSLPFTLRFQFVGEVKLAARGAATVFSGVAKLAEPFRLQTQLSVAIDGDGRHELRFAADVAAVLDREVRPRLPAAARATYDRLVQPYAPQLRDCAVVVASHASEDHALGTIGAGFNAYAEVPFAAVEPTRALSKSFPRAQLDARKLSLHVGCRNEPALAFVIEDSAAIGAELGTPAVTLDGLALRVTQDSPSPAGAAALQFTLRVGGETLVFAGTLAEAGGGNVAIRGNLDVAGGTWGEPFGARGVTLAGVQVRLVPLDAAPYVRVELQGITRIGGERVDAKPALQFDAAAPERAVLRLVSDVATDLRRLLAGLVDVVHLPAELVKLPFDDYALAIAPNGGTIEGKTYDTGISLRGAIDLWGWRANVDGALSFAGGGHLYGAMSPIAFPAEGWLVNIRGAGEGGPSLALDFSETKRGVHLSGAVKIVTRYNHTFELVVASDRFKLLLGKTKLGIYAGGVLEVGDGKLTLTAESTFRGRCTVPLGRQAIALDADVAAAYRATGTRDGVRQDVAFRLDACGTHIDFSANAGTLRFEEVESLAQFFAQQGERIGQLIAQALLSGPLAAIAWLQQYLPDPTQVAMVARDVGLACAAAADSIRQVFAVGAEACATSLRQATYSTQAIAGAMVTAYGLSEQAVGLLLDKIGVPAKEIAKAMHKAFDWSAEKTAEFCEDALDLSDKATKKALEAADYSSKEIKRAMKDVFGWTESMWDSFVDLF